MDTKNITKSITKSITKNITIEKGFGRCNECNKKSHILFKCKCLNEYCNKHILPEIHKCKNIELYNAESFEKNKDSVVKNSIKSKKIDVI